MPLTHDQFKSILPRVARSLREMTGNIWGVRHNPDDYAPGGMLHDTTSGMELYVQNAAYNKPTLMHVSAVAPKDKRGEVPHVVYNRRPSINVSLAKTPEQVAADVARRLLPEWQPLYEQALAQIREKDEGVRLTTSIASELARIGGGKADGTEVSFYHSRYPIFAERLSKAKVWKLDGIEVELELRLTPEEAAALLEYMVR